MNVSRVNLIVLYCLTVIMTYVFRQKKSHGENWQSMYFSFYHQHSKLFELSKIMLGTVY